MLGALLIFLLGVGLTIAVTTYYHPILTPQLQKYQQLYSYYHKKYWDLRKKFSDVWEKYTTLQAENYQLKTKYEAALSTIKDLRQKYNNALTQVSVYKREAENYKQRLQQLEKQLNQTKQELEKLKKQLNATLTTLEEYKRKLSQAHDMADRYLDLIEELNQEVETLRQQVLEYKSKYNELQKEYNRLKQNYLDLKQDVAYIIEANFNSLQESVDIVSNYTRQTMLNNIFGYYKTFNPQTYLEDFKKIMLYIYYNTSYIDDPAYPPTGVEIIVRDENGNVIYKTFAQGLVDPKAYEYLMSSDTKYKVEVKTWGTAMTPQGLRYGPYEGDVTYPPWYTMRYRKGDCDDFAVLMEETVNGYCASDKNCWAGVLVVNIFGRSGTTKVVGPGHATTFINITYFGTPRYVICDPTLKYCTPEYTNFEDALRDYAINVMCNVAKRYNIPNAYIQYRFLVKERKRVKSRLFGNYPMIELPDYESPIKLDYKFTCPS